MWLTGRGQGLFCSIPENGEDEAWLTGRGRGLFCSIPENGEDEVRLTSSARVLFCSIPAAEANQSDRPFVNTSKCRNTAPPQHCCSMGPRGNSSIWRCAPVSDTSARRSRAMRMASNSRLPPPMVPITSVGVTIIRAPGSRGADPATCATVTSTHGSPRVTTSCNAEKQRFIAAVGLSHREHRGHREAEA